MRDDQRELAGPAGLEIRPVRTDDVAALNEIRRQPRVAAFTLALPSEREADTNRFVEALTPDDHLLVALLDGRVVGLAGLHVQRGKLRHVGVLGMGVHDDFQRRGIGRRLLAALLDLADNWLGLRRVELEVLADNGPAIGLYERFGFRVEGRQRQRIYQAGLYADSLIMARLRAPGKRPPAES